MGAATWPVINYRGKDSGPRERGRVQDGDVGQLHLGMTSGGVSGCGSETGIQELKMEMQDVQRFERWMQKGKQALGKAQEGLGVNERTERTTDGS